MIRKQGGKMYKFIDLCAGIGGIRRGFELGGDFKCVLSAEKDRFCCLTYKHLFGTDPQNDITTEEFKQLCEKMPYDILLAGFPCQPFSRAGAKEGFIDKTRGTLFFDIAQILKRSQPKAFLLENVDNLISHDRGKTFDTILNVLQDELDYKIIGVKKVNGENVFDRKSILRNSRNFGIPQNRPRVYIMGFSRKAFGDAVDSLPESLPAGREKPIYKTLDEIIDFNADPKYYLSQNYVKTLKAHAERHKNKGNGFHYKILNDPQSMCEYSNTLLVGGSGKERNLIIDKQDWIPGKIVTQKRSPLNNQCIRTMTPKEWGKLQGFVGYAFMENGVDKFSFPTTVSDTQKYRQFGNSVTIPVIEEMAKFMTKCLKNLLCNPVPEQLSESDWREAAFSHPERTVRIGTVFSGIGAIEHAFKRLNLKHELVFAGDLDTNCKKSFLANYSLDENNWFTDIKDFDAKIYENRIDLLVGGAPCQAFSVAGKRLGFNDPRGTLFYEFARVVNETKPKVFVFENVKGLLKNNKGETWRTIWDTFRNLGYDLHFRTLNSRDYGIPQNRVRLFCIGFKEKTDFRFPAPIPLNRLMCDVLETDVADKYYLSEKGTKYVMQSGTKNYHKKPEINPDVAKTLLSTMHKMHRVGIDNYVTQNGRLRKLTPREGLRLMGFQDTFRIVVSDTAMYQEIGNSIVVDVLMALLKEMDITKYGEYGEENPYD